MPGYVSGPQQPNWTVPPGSVNTADGALSWGINYDTDMHLDVADIRPQNVHGVTAHIYANPSSVAIINGTITQGAGGSFSSHGVSVVDQETALLEGLTISTHGLESAGIWVNYSSNVMVSGNSITTTGEHKFNRHQLSAAVNVLSSQHSTIEGNEVHSGEGWGGILQTGADGVIHDNTVYTSSVITNHYGIIASGTDHLVRHNTIHADPGQGLRVDGQRIIADDNDITIYSVAPNQDIGRFSLDGIRVNDYWNGTDQDITVRNNRITIYGNNSPYYQVAAHVLNGIMNVTNGAGIVYEGNTITAIKVDSEVAVSGIQPGSSNELVLWRDNTIISDQWGIMFGGYAGKSHNSRFENTRFIRGANAGADYAVLGGTYNVANTTFYNTIIEGGGTLRSIAGPSWSSGAAI